MNQYVVSPILHGVQFSEIQDDYASDFIQGVKSFLPEDQRGFWVPVPYNWTHLTHGRQMFVYSLVESGLMNQKLRKLKHVVGSDVVWSARAKPGTKCFYNDFVLELTEKINYHLNIYKGAKLITMGHSQGTQLLLCYFFDYPSIVDGFMSMGSPISMGSGSRPRDRTRGNKKAIPVEIIRAADMNTLGRDFHRGSLLNGC